MHKFKVGDTIIGSSGNIATIEKVGGSIYKYSTYGRINFNYVRVIDLNYQLTVKSKLKLICDEI